MSEDLELHELVRQTYSRIGESPQAGAPFPTGRILAEALGYHTPLLDTLPTVSVEAFCGVANLWAWVPLADHHQVLDLGCGAGLDTILAAWRSDKVWAVDFSQTMLKRNRQAVAEAGLQHKVAHLRAEAQKLPLSDESVDIALVNGLFNLNPFREQVFRELARVLKPGGSVFAAEIVLQEDALTRTDSIDWFS